MGETAGVVEPNGDVKQMGKMSAFANKMKKLGYRVGNKFNKLGKKVGGWFSHTFSAQDMDENDLDDALNDLDDALNDYYYYQYDENLADQLDEEHMTETADTSNMINFMYPLVEGAAKYITPLMEATQGFVGGALNKAMQSVGLGRRRMEDDAVEEEEQEQNEDEEENNDNAMFADYGDEDYEEYEDEDEDYGDEYYEDEYYEDEENEDEDVIDGWYDEETEMDWVITNEDADLQMAELEDDNWDLIDQIKSIQNVPIQRKCMNVFGTKICICEFLEFIHAQPASKVCGPKYGSGAVANKPAKIKTKKKPPAKLLEKSKAKTPPKIGKGKQKKKKKESGPIAFKPINPDNEPETPQKSGKAEKSLPKKIPQKPKTKLPPKEKGKTKPNLPLSPPSKPKKTKNIYVKPLVKPGEPTPKPYKMKQIPPKVPPKENAASKKLPKIVTESQTKSANNIKKT